MTARAAIANDRFAHNRSNNLIEEDTSSRHDGDEGRAALMLRAGLANRHHGYCRPNQGGRRFGQLSPSNRKYRRHADAKAI